MLRAIDSANGPDFGSAMATRSSPTERRTRSERRVSREQPEFATTIEHWMTLTSSAEHPETLTMLMRLLRHGGFDRLPVLDPVELSRLERDAFLGGLLHDSSPHVLLALGQDTPLSAAARLISRLEVGGLAVADPNGDLIGVITALDVLRGLIGRPEAFAQAGADV
jgi:hypothetical protein